MYAVEFLSNITEERMSESMITMELKLVSEVLNCNDLPSRKFFRHRRLVGDGVAGLDYMPLDTKNEDVLCFSNSTADGVCKTYFGHMVLYLEKDADEQVEINNMLYYIRNAKWSTCERYAELSGPPLLAVQVDLLAVQISPLSCLSRFQLAVRAPSERQSDTP